MEWHGMAWYGMVWYDMDVSMGVSLGVGESMGGGV